MTRRLHTLFFATLAVSALVAQPARAQRLFRTDSVLTVTITTSLGPLLKQRDSLELVKHPAVFAYDNGGNTVSVPVRLRARGHFRRQARNCDFPPLWLDIKSSDAKQTVLSGLNKMKITTSCRPKSAEYEQYILQEFAVYRMYSALTENSFRTRLLHVTFRDTAGKTAPVTSWAFLIESVDDVAIQLKRSVLPAQGARFEDLDQDALSLLSMFEYFIGNTDWSISALHNTALLQDSSAHIVPIAFDFDWVGAVDARYAFPDKMLKIRSVTDRLYRGNCPTPAQFKTVLDRFRAKRPAMDAVFAQLPQLAPDRVKKMQSYFNDFWKRIDDPRGLQREISDDCQKSGN
jgi:hypothetical protein